MAKTVRIEGTFAVKRADQVSVANETFKTELQVTQGSGLFPHKIAGNQSDVALAFGGITLAKRVFIRTSHEVTLKIGQDTDDGFPFGPGEGIFPSYTGIAGIFVTTGPNETEVDVIVAGD